MWIYYGESETRLNTDLDRFNTPTLAIRTSPVISASILGK
jgi:hypothetical protein